MTNLISTKKGDRKKVVGAYLPQLSLQTVYLHSLAYQKTSSTIIAELVEEWVQTQDIETISHLIASQARAKYVKLSTKAEKNSFLKSFSEQLASQMVDDETVDSILCLITNE